MTEVIAYPDAEATVVSWLATKLTAASDTATVGTFIPNPRPDRLVRIVRLGGVLRNLVQDQALIVADCWDVTEIGAGDLMRLVRAYIGAMPGETIGGVTCYAVTEVTGPENRPDPDSGTPRYTYSAQVLLRGSAL